MQMVLLLAYVNLLCHSISVLLFQLFAIAGDDSVHMGQILAANKPGGMRAVPPQSKNFPLPC